MEFLYQQICLDDSNIQSTVRELAYKVLSELHGYADNHPVYIDIASNNDLDLMSIALNLLKKHKIILYIFRDDEYAYGYDIVTLNRYKLELLLAELDWLAMSEEERRNDPDTAPFADYVVYYNLKSGEMLFNGTYKVLKGRNKALFDVLYTDSPNYVPRNKLLASIGTNKKTLSSKILLNEAFTNLRKICGVSKHVIQLSSSNGGRLYHIETHSLSAQTPPSRFLTD